MSARFRIRTAQGQELSFATHEMFAEFVRSGDLAPDDVVFDAETKEWAPARTHPLVLQIEYEEEESAPEEVAEAVDEVRQAEPVQESLEAADLDFDLAPAVERTPEEAAAAFVAKMEAERASDLDFDDDAGVEGLKMEHGSSSLIDDVVEAAPPPEPARAQKRPASEAAPKPGRGRPRPRSRREPRRDQPSPPPRRAAPKAEPKKRKRKKGAGAGRKYAPFIIMVAVLAAAGVYFGPELLGPVASGGADSGESADSAPAPPAPPPLIPDTEEALWERAQERFLGTTRVLLRELQPIPDGWLTGQYLATPSDYPRVRDVWQSYLGTVREVRAGDDQRFRAGYLTALDDARVEGEARTLRLTAGTEQFLQTLGDRVAHYDRVEAMAIVAIQGHDALVEAEGTISYEPAVGGPTLSADPVIEAVGRNPDAQAFLDQVLDLMLSELHGEGGPGEVGNVHAWVYDGLLDAVAN